MLRGALVDVLEYEKLPRMTYCTQGSRPKAPLGGMQERRQPAGAAHRRRSLHLSLARWLNTASVDAPGQVWGAAVLLVWCESRQT